MLSVVGIVVGLSVHFTATESATTTTPGLLLIATTESPTSTTTTTEGIKLLRFFLPDGRTFLALKGVLLLYAIRILKYFGSLLPARPVVNTV